MKILVEKSVNDVTLRERKRIDDQNEYIEVNYCNIININQTL